MYKKFLIGALNVTLTIILTALLLLGIFMVNNTSKTDVIIHSIAYTIASIILIRLYFTQKKILYNVTQFICIVLNIIIIYNIYILNNNYGYIENILTNKYYYETYNVYVLKNTSYDNLNELENKKIGLLKQESDNIKKVINNIAKVTYKEYDSVNELQKDITTGAIQSYILKDGSTTNTTIIQKIQIRNTK